MSMGENFIIPLSDLTTGRNEFSWHVGKEFFESFENAEILDAELDAVVSTEKSGRYVGIDCNVSGTLVVECDRCLGDLTMPVDVDILLSVKYGNEESSEEHQEGEREVVFVPEDNADFDLSQTIYDYVCLSLPMQRCHEEGDCDPAAMKYLGASEDADAFGEEERDNPFASLKDMFK